MISGGITEFSQFKKVVVCCTTLHRYLQKEGWGLFISFCDPFYVVAVLGSDQQFLLALNNGLAKSVHLDEKLIKFDEVGVKAFAARMPDILRQAGFKGTMLEILASFCSGLEVVYQNLLQTPTSVDWWWVWSKGPYSSWLSSCPNIWNC